MALVDVTELLVDSDFVDPCILIHRTTTVNDFGENVLVESSMTTIGSVQPASGRDLERLPDELRTKNISTFWIKGQIISDGTSKYPDLIVFKKRRYAVQHVFDWMNYGPGYCSGVAVVEVPIS